MLERRTFLMVVGSIAATNACSSDGASAADVGDVAAGPASALAVGSLTALRGEPVCVGRDGAGIYAMTLICTHQGCDIGQDGSVSAQGLYCGCHGSRFAADGTVVSGPAPWPLAHFSVSADATGT